MKHVSDSIENRVAALVRTLPPLDQSVDRLLEATIEGHSDPTALESMIYADPCLCSSLLFLANCACYKPGGRGAPIETVKEALDHVDLSALATMVGASAALSTVEQGPGIPRRQWDDYLQHSREIASLCTILAEISGLPAHQREIYAVAGLTHDVGRVVMMAAAHGTAASFLGTTPDEMNRIVADEQAAYKLDHCQIGHALFEKWDFSEPLRQGILRHHSPLISEDFCQHGGLIFISHFVTMSDFTGEIIARMLPAELLRRLSLQARDINQARTLYAGRQRATAVH